MSAWPAILFTILDANKMIRNGDSVQRAGLTRAKLWSAGKLRGNEEKACITLPTMYSMYLCYG